MPWNLPTNVDESWTHHPSSRCRSTPAGYRSLAVPCQSFCCCCFVLFFLLMLKVFVFRWTTVYSWDQWRLSPQSLRWQVRGSFHIPLLKLLLHAAADVPVCNQMMALMTFCGQSSPPLWESCLQSHSVTQRRKKENMWRRNQRQNACRRKCWKLLANC